LRNAIHNLIGRIFLTAILALAWPALITAQELNCTVRVDNTAISGTEQFAHIPQLKALIEEYMNNRAWTSDRFRPEERIKCDIEITMLAGSSTGFDNFSAQLSVGISRPIYGTMQTTNVAQIADGNWRFAYEPNASLLYDPDRFNTLTSVLDFYAYLILGYDYDSFMPFGGTPLFERAREIVFLAPQGGAGWTVGSENTRGTLVTQLLDPRLSPLRQAYFDYHFRCLDHFVQDPTLARQAALDALTAIQAVINDVSNQYVIDLFLATKNQEIVGIFEESSQASKAYGILLDIDPSRSSIYDRLAR
jgi:hypothetical protein